MSAWPKKQPSLSLQEAKKILGTTAQGLSDEAINRLVCQIDVLTDIVIAHANGSKYHSTIDISDKRYHTAR